VIYVEIQMYENKTNQMSPLICGLNVIFLTFGNENMGLLELFILTSLFCIMSSDILTESIYVHMRVSIDY
jgi:hypothetical protein